jgi:hypothetical protein
MSESIFSGMYQNNMEDSDPDFVSPQPNTGVSISHLGKVTRVTIDGQELTLINPAVIDQLEKQYHELLNRSHDLQQRCMRMQQQQTTMINTIVRLERELGNKVSYD